MAIAQATSVDYQLHTLGWKSFQDLCISVASEILGQSVRAFLATNDAGRDGAFTGTWTTSNGKGVEGEFVIQCKHTSTYGASLSISALSEELTKAAALASIGVCDNYFLMTNFRLSSRTELAIKEAFSNIDGIRHIEIWAKETIEQKIRESSRLRMLVPRVYGLGDLSNILDARAVLQAQELLSSLGDDLSNFVITDAYLNSVSALSEHGFVILLGEPAVGKSTIAASLALGALDRWKCQALCVNSPDELISHWNPNEAQFFWVDDAFGATQFIQSRIDEWNRIFPKLKAAIATKARIVFTSRDYIFRRAHRELKTTAFPLLNESQVIINVHSLSQTEREQILYNHIKLGDQSRHWKETIQPLLPFVSAHDGFIPEIARRLGKSKFTESLNLNKPSISRFIEHPLEFLIDCINNIDQHSFAALALLYMRNGKLENPIECDASEQSAIEKLRSSIGEIGIALSALNHVYVRLITRSGETFWAFKHPTIRDAVSRIVVGDPALLDVYLAGATIGNLVEEVFCGESTLEGAVIVPKSRYEAVITKLNISAKKHEIVSFLTSRCDADFCSSFIQSSSFDFEFCDLGNGYFQTADDPLVALASKFHRYGLLSEDDKQSIYDSVKENARDRLDVTFLSDQVLRSLFTVEEVTSIVKAIDKQLDSCLRNALNWWDEGYTKREDPEEYFEVVSQSLDTLAEHLPFASKPKLRRAHDELSEFIEEKKEAYEPREGWNPEREYYDTSIGSSDSDRSIFDDIHL